MFLFTLFEVILTFESFLLAFKAFLLAFEAFILEAFLIFKALFFVFYLSVFHVPLKFLAHKVYTKGNFLHQNPLMTYFILLVFTSFVTFVISFVTSYTIWSNVIIRR